jgi:hypothetical protein
LPIFQARAAIFPRRTQMEQSLKISRCFLSLAACVAVAACAIPYPTVVSNVQTFYGNLKTDAATWCLTHPQDQAAITKIEAKLDPEVNGLSNTSAPTSIQAVVNDIVIEAGNLPAGVLSPAHQADLTLVVTAAEGLTLFLPPASTAPAATAPPVPPPAPDGAAP